MIDYKNVYDNAYAEQWNHRGQVNHHAQAAGLAAVVAAAKAEAFEEARVAALPKYHFCTPGCDPSCEIIGSAQ